MAAAECGFQDLIKQARERRDRAVLLSQPTMVLGEEENDVNDRPRPGAQKVIKVVRTIKKRKTGHKASTTTPVHGDESEPTSSHESQLSDAESGKYYYEGGWSQWRNDSENEEKWKEWDWPPADWRPEPHHNAFADPQSEFYRFKTFDWDDYNRRVQEQLWSPRSDPSARDCAVPSTPTTLRSGSDVSAIAHQLQRMNTGEILELSPSSIHASLETANKQAEIADRERKAQEMMTLAMGMLEQAKNM
ncbi:unnamed protein product, partial [Durusdinium trenchii]